MSIDLRFDSISFIIPIYDVSVGYFKECINSIRVQDIRDYEIVIVNDGSTIEELNNYCIKLSKDNDIVYITQENQGSAVARNIALEYASKSYVIFVDADDKLDCNLFKNLICLEENFDIYCFDYTFIDGDEYKRYTLLNEEKISKNDLIANVLFLPEKLDNLMFGALWAKCISRDFLIKNKIRFQPELRKAQDRAFMLEVYIKANCILYMPINSYYYRINSDSITHKINYNMIIYYQSLNNYIHNFCKNNNINKDLYKFFTYSIFGEMLTLTYFNKQCKYGVKKKKREIERLYDSFNLKKELKDIHFNDFKKITGKVKYIMYKYKLFLLLDIVVKMKGQ